MSSVEPISLPELAESVEPHNIQLLRATQFVRTRQSMRALPLGGIISLAIIGAFATRMPFVGAWGALFLCSALLRGIVSRNIARNLETATFDQLQKFERWLVATSVLNGTTVGSGIWWVSLVDAPTSAIYAVVLVCVLYASLSMISASVQLDTFIKSTVMILGQSILFFLSKGSLDGFAVATGLIVALMLQIGFGRLNASHFEESIKMRTENQRLLKQLGEEKKVVDGALIQAKEANESKSRFLAAASHDLRQPLHALGLYLGSLEMLVTNEQAQKILGKVTNTATVLTDQFNSLLDLSQFDAGGVQMEQALFRIDILLRRSLASFENDLNSKGLSITANYQPITVVSDPILLERMIRNLRKL